MIDKNTLKEQISLESFYSGFFPEHKLTSNGEWLVICPFHDDHHPSMNVNIKTGLFFCHSCGAKGDYLEFYQKKTGRSFSDSVNEIGQQVGVQPAQPIKPKIVKTYDYLDMNGNLVSQTVRYEPKKFSQRTKVNGQWVWSLKSVRPVLYNLQDVINADVVLLMEGEKDCDTAKELGYVATTCPMGAGSWRADYSQCLYGKEVILMPDNDQVGIKHMLSVGKLLKDKSTVKWFEFPAKNQKGFDFTDLANSFDNEFEAMKNIDILLRSARAFDESKIIIPIPDSKESDQIKAWISDSPGEFTVKDLDYDLGFQNSEQRVQRTKILEKFVAENVLSREGKRRGVYRPYHKELEVMDYMEAKTGFLPIWMPMSIHKMVGIMPGNIIVLAGDANAGKALKNDTPVLTSEGWVNISNITTDHIIFGKNGKRESVLGVYPQQGKRDCYRFNFSDGSWVDSDGEHIWTLQTNYQMNQKLSGNGNKNKTYKQWIDMTTNQLIFKYGIGKLTKRRPKLPINESIEFEPVNVPIDPYILGALLGDGGIANDSIKIHSEDAEVLERFAGLGYILTHDNGVSYRIAVKTENIKIAEFIRSENTTIPEHTRFLDIPEEHLRLKTHLQELGLLGRHSHDKFIPKNYLINDIKTRTEVLKGLMDTDGYIDESGRTIEFCSVSKQLAEDVQFLARSLGARAVLTMGDSSYKKNGVRVKCLDKFRVFITTDKPVFYLSRKLKRQRAFLKTNEKKIVSIENIGKHETTCIMTSAKDGLFVAKDFTVTHNTAMMLNIIKNNMTRFNVHYFNSEMGGNELKTRMEKFDDIHIDQWKYNAYSRDCDFADVVFTGEKSLNIIDFLEIHDDFYLVGEKIKQIHSALKGGVAIIAIQKNKGSDLAVGGNRTMEKARLVVNVESGRFKITKAKNFIDPTVNPNGMMCDWKLVNGCRFVMNGAGWYKN